MYLYLVCFVVQLYIVALFFYLCNNCLCGREDFPVPLSIIMKPCIQHDSQHWLYLINGMDNGLEHGMDYGLEDGMDSGLEDGTSNGTVTIVLCLQMLSFFLIES